MCLSQRRERLECFSSSNETWQTLKASQCDAGGAQSAVTAASPCQSDCVEVLGELWGIWEAAIKPELCHRRGGVINCGDYYREFLGVYNSCGFLEEEEVKRSHLTRGGNIFQSYISTWKRVCVCVPECITTSPCMWEWLLADAGSDFPPANAESSSLNLSWTSIWWISFSRLHLHTEHTVVH